MEKPYEMEEGHMARAEEPVVAYGMNFTPAQRALINTFAYIKTDEEVNDLRNAISDYFARKAQLAIDKLWDEGVINVDVLEQWKKEHMRTPYK